MWRSSCRYQQQSDRDEGLRKQLTKLAHERPRFGYRRLAVLLDREGKHVNHKRVFRVYRESGLSVKRNRRKKLLRTGVSRPVLTGPNQEWSLDFVHDALASGRSVRVLSVVDNFTRECLALEADTSFASQRVTRVLETVIASRGAPQALRMDNGPELTSRHFLVWCMERKITMHHIQPGKPMQNGHVESFNGRFRDECLNANWFPQSIRCTNQDCRVAARLQQCSPAQQLGVSNSGRVRRPVATPFVLGSLDIAGGTARKAFPYGALTRGLDGRTRLQRTTIMRTEALT